VETRAYSESRNYSESHVWTATRRFDESDLLTQTEILLVSEPWTISEKQTTTDGFSMTSAMSETGNLFQIMYLATEEFNQSLNIEISLQLVRTWDVLYTERLTITANFSKSDLFEETEEFVESAPINASHLSPASPESATFTTIESPTASEQDPVFWSDSALRHYTARFNITDSFTETEMFGRTAALNILFVDELQSIWGYLCAILALMILGTALLIRSLVLMEQLDGGLTIEDEGSEPTWREEEEEERNEPPAVMSIALEYDEKKDEVAKETESPTKPPNFISEDSVKPDSDISVKLDDSSLEFGDSYMAMAAFFVSSSTG
jgi:hypothetical protein